MFHEQSVDKRKNGSKSNLLCHFCDTSSSEYQHSAATNGRIFHVIYEMDAQWPGNAKYRA